MIFSSLLTQKNEFKKPTYKVTENFNNQDVMNVLLTGTQLDPNPATDLEEEEIEIDIKLDDDSNTNFSNAKRNIASNITQLQNVVEGKSGFFTSRAIEHNLEKN